MPAPWPELPYDAWHETRDTLHAILKESPNPDLPITGGHYPATVAST